MAQGWAPVYRPTRQEFEQTTFLDYVTGVFREQPDLPCFKVVPPAGWRARSTPYPDLETVWIDTPIRQHVFGKAGAYRCMLVEAKKLNVASFQKLAEEEAARLTNHRKGQAGITRPVGVLPAQAPGATGVPSSSAAPQPPKTATRQDAAVGAQGGEGGGGGGGGASSNSALVASQGVVDALDERAFWASITLNPPMYGADTPMSFFDEELLFGWNLRNLGDLLQTCNVPQVPGVTTPMCYFGSWRAFFGWHKEDKDLLSINYIHFGAPKVWYCISPKHAALFERMCASLFPEQARQCSAFIRHKELLVSPSQLRTYGVPFTMTKHEAGEFIVLNAAAYHAGYNMGFNAAEAINFATEDWVPIGKAANVCRCEVMRDAVQMSMRIFDPEYSDPYSPGASSYDDTDGSSSGQQDDSVSLSSDASEHTTASEVLRQRAQQRVQALLQHAARQNRAAAGAPATGAAAARVAHIPPAPATHPTHPAPHLAPAGQPHAQGSAPKLPKQQPKGVGRRFSSPQAAAIDTLIEGAKLRRTQLQQQQRTPAPLPPPPPPAPGTRNTRLHPDAEPPQPPVPGSSLSPEALKLLGLPVAHASQKRKRSSTSPGAAAAAAATGAGGAAAARPARDAQLPAPSAAHKVVGPAISPRSPPSKRALTGAGDTAAKVRTLTPVQLSPQQQQRQPHRHVEAEVEVVHLDDSSSDGGSEEDWEQEQEEQEEEQEEDVEEGRGHGYGSGSTPRVSQRERDGVRRSLRLSPDKPQLRRHTSHSTAGAASGAAHGTALPVLDGLPDGAVLHASGVVLMPVALPHAVAQPQPSTLPAVSGTAAAAQPLPSAALPGAGAGAAAQPLVMHPPQPPPRGGSLKGSGGGGGGAQPKQLQAQQEQQQQVADEVRQLVAQLQQDPARGPPYAVVWESEGQRQFHLVQELRQPSRTSKEYVRLRLFHEDPSDGLYRPALEVWEELRTALVPVRTRQVLQLSTSCGAVTLPAYQLLTHKARILDTVLVG